MTGEDCFLIDAKYILSDLEKEIFLVMTPRDSLTVTNIANKMDAVRLVYDFDEMVDRVEVIKMLEANVWQGYLLRIADENDVESKYSLTEKGLEEKMKLLGEGVEFYENLKS